MTPNASVLTSSFALLSAGLALSLALAVPVLADPEGMQREQTTVFVIRTEEEAQQMVRLHASADREVLYTTVSFTHRGFYAGHMADFAAHLWQSLREVGRMENSIIISYDLHTCQGIMQRGIPCFLDRWSLQPAQLPGQYGTEVPHWYSKYSWGLKLLEWNYTAVFMEMDMVFSADPLPFFQRTQYDIEGLSDWRIAEVPDPKDRFTSPCTVYHTVKREDGHQTLDWGPGDMENPRHTRHINPCMSTGFWFLRPSVAAKMFMRDFIQLAVYELTADVDQIVWNQAIMAYLTGSAKFNPPLRIGLLDDEKFSNFEVYNWRVEKGLPAKPVMLHCGALGPGEKWPMLDRLGFWKAHWWDPAAATPMLEKLTQLLPRGLPHGQRGRHKP